MWQLQVENEYFVLHKRASLHAQPETLGRP